MKFLPLTLGIIPGLLIASTVPIEKDIVQVKECGMEQRDGYGQLLPIAVSSPVELKCFSCSVEFNFNVPAGGGYPTSVELKYSGMPKEQANEYKSAFIHGWAFPGCRYKGNVKGFVKERRAFNA